MAERCAVVGIGQTHHKKRRDDVSIPGLLREAALRALEDAEMTFADIDALVRAIDQLLEKPPQSNHKKISSKRQKLG